MKSFELNFVSQILIIRYTYGQPVRGSFVARITVKSTGWNFRERKTMTRRVEVRLLSNSFYCNDWGRGEGIGEGRGKGRGEGRGNGDRGFEMDTQ